MLLVIVILVFMIFGLMSLAGFINLKKLNNIKCCWQCKKVLKLDKEYGVYCVHCGVFQAY